MGKVLTAYAVGLLEKWYAVLIGVAFGLFGFLKDGLGIDIPVPSWIWWAGAVATVFVVQFWMYYEMYKDHEALRAPGADVSLAQVVEQIIGTNDFWGEGISKVGEALPDIREKAHLRYISSWARMERESEPLGAVPQSTWEAHQINLLKFCQNPRGRLEATRPGVERADYLDFYFNSAQVNMAWPKKRNWLALRLLSRTRATITSASVRATETDRT
jgi:hypothetical protein